MSKPSETKTPLAALIYAPFPNVETAREAARILLDERLIACANILGEVESLFIWNAKQHSETEVGVLFKTTQTAIDIAVNRLGALHPYETPAIVASVCDTAHPDTLKWLVEQTGDESTA